MVLSGFEDVCFRYTYESDRTRQIGGDGHIRIKTFVDLMSAAHGDDDLRVIATAMAGMVEDVVRGFERPAVIGPKTGNTLLIRDVARLLNIPSAFIRHQPLFGRWVEGSILPGSQAVIIDDVSSDGELLEPVVERARTAGHLVDYAIFAVNRKEGDADSALRKLGVELRCLVNWDDYDLRTLQTKARLRGQ